MALLLIVIYYVFAIIGMESFHGRVFPGCWYVGNRSRNSVALLSAEYGFVIVNKEGKGISHKIQGLRLICVHCLCLPQLSYWKSDFFFFSNESLFNVGSYYAGDENATTPQIYWLNNFDNILRSYGMCV